MRHAANNSLTPSPSFRVTNKREPSVPTDQSCHCGEARCCGLTLYPQHITMPILVKIGQSIAKISGFFQATILEFRNSVILLVDGVWRVEMHHHAKFRQNPSICCEDIMIFNFSRWWPSAILDLFGAYLDHPQRVAYLVVFITAQNLVAIDAVV